MRKDLNLILLKDSPSSSPYVSFPLTLGHENCGYVVEVGRDVTDIEVGDRVVVDPLLSCAAGRLMSLAGFARPETSPCAKIIEGHCLAWPCHRYCRDTGGGWSESFVAHKSQVIRLPDNVSLKRQP